MHAELLNHSFHDLEGLRLRAFEYQEQETCNKVHTLTIVQRLLINYRIAFENIVEVFSGYRLHRVE